MNNELFATKSFILLIGDKLILKTPYKKQFVAECREIPERIWVGEPKEHNEFPVTSVTFVLDLCDRWGIKVSDEIRNLPPSGDTSFHPRSITKEDNKLCIKFLYNPEILANLKTDLPQAKWKPEIKTWIISEEFSDAVIKFAMKWDFHVESGIAEAVDKLMAERQANFDLSLAVDLDVEIPDANKALLPYQKVGVAYLLKARRAILGDQPGLGKTLQALSTVVSEGAFPAVVVCPNTLKLNWRNEIKKFYPDLSINIVSGKKEEGLPSADITIINYDIVYERVDDLLALKPITLIADESHAIKNGKAFHTCPNCEAKVRSNAKNCSACHSHHIKPNRQWTVKRAGGVLRLAENIPEEGMVLLLTGTPITNRPIELVPQLEAIGALDYFGGRWKFESRYCPNGKGAAFMEELNRKMRSVCYIRRKKQDVYGELPDVRNAVQILNIPASGYAKYQKIEQDVIDFFAQKAREIAIEEGEDANAAYWEKFFQLQYSEHLVRLTALRDAVANMKYDAIADWLDEFLEAGDEKVIVFAEHIDIVEKLAERYGNKAVKVRGGVSNDDRMAAVDRFQTDPTCRIFIGNMKAASEGLTLTAASDVVFCELGWTPAIHEQCVGRAYGRVNDLHGATAWYLLAEKTIDEDIFELLEEKKKVVDAVTDGNDPAEGSNVIIDLMKRLTERGLNDR